MVLNTIQFHYSNNLIKINNQKFINYNIIVTCLVSQESDLGHCLHSKCQITAKFAFVDISTDGYYVALNASNVQYLSFDGHLKYHKKQLKKFNNK